MKEELLGEAALLEAKLLERKISIKVLSIVLTNSLKTFVFKINDTTKVDTLRSLSEDIALWLGAKTAAVSRKGGVTSIEIPFTGDSGETLSFNDILKMYSETEPAVALLGKTNEGDMLGLRIDSPNTVHILLCGRTGSGKTGLARTIIASLAYFDVLNDLEIVLIDPKRNSFEPLSKLPQALKVGIIDSAAEAKNKLQELVVEMELRDKTSIKSPMIFVAIDELADLVMSDGDEIRGLIERLLQRGREANIHVMVCTQKPTAAVLGTLGKANFPVRLVGAVASRKEATFASGISNSNAEKLNGKGDFLVVIGGDIQRFQAFWMSREDFDEILEDIVSRN